MNDNKFQKIVFRLDGRISFLGNLLCLLFAIALNIGFMVIIEPPNEDNADGIFFVALAMFALYSFVFLPIEWAFRRVFSDMFPYITIPFLIYFVVIFFSCLYFVNLEGNDLKTWLFDLLFDSFMLAFVHFPIVFYSTFKAILYQFSPTKNVVKQTRADILDDI
jgi:hypothetical protein